MTRWHGPAIPQFVWLLVSADLWVAAVCLIIWCIR